MRAALLTIPLIGLAVVLAIPAKAQTPEQRALIGRLQQGNTPCNPGAGDQRSMEDCSRRALAREIGKQQGYCWTEPRSASNNGPIMRCDPKKR
jgi:surface antigen